MALQDRQAKIEAEQKLQLEAARRTQLEQDMEKLKLERDREREIAKMDKERADRLEVELCALRETHRSHT